MASDLEIANFALGHLGESKIDAAEWAAPTTKAGVTAELWFDTARRRVLRLANWTCMTKRVEIDEDATEPVWGYGHRYELPADFLRLVYIRNAAPRSWEIEENFILIDLSSPLRIKYVADVADKTLVSAFTDDLVEALALSWAYDMCMTLTQSRTRKEDLWEEMEAAIRVAKNVDTTGASPRHYSPGSWIRGR